MTPRKLFGVCFIGLICLQGPAKAASICDAVPGNLVQNCGFEITTPTPIFNSAGTQIVGEESGGPFTDWQATPFAPLPNGSHIGEGGGVYDFLDACAPDFSPNQNSGSCFGIFGNTTPDQIQQNLTTVAGDNYVFSFDLAALAVGNSSFQAYWDGTLVYNDSRDSLIDYAPFSFTVMATGSDSVTFVGVASQGYYDLDDVVVADQGPGTPEPATWATMLAGFLGIMSVCRVKRFLRRPTTPWGG